MTLLLFRAFAIIEGVSYLLLFVIGMPLKYWGNLPTPNIYLGYLHGFLFLAYVVLAGILTRERSLGVRKFLWFLLASLLPFGTFYLESHYLKRFAASQKA